jgi:electron transport complex protein RnfD
VNVIAPAADHQASPPSVRRIMAMVLAALLPAIAVSTALFGLGVPVQIFLALAFALALEASMLFVRRQPLTPFLADFSAAVTAVLFALLVPPTAPWWFAALGMVVAIVFAKHVFGGLGKNLFNPAMAGLVAVRLCFPQQFQAWPIPPQWFGIAAIWLAAAYAGGGLFLLWKGIIRWQTPVATLAAAALSAALAWLLAANSPLHSSMVPALWMLAAFFIVTDPVTGCITARGRLIFGAGVGAAGVAIGYGRDDPYGFAYAVLLMNCLAPWIDLRTRSRTRAATTVQAEPPA